MINPECNFIFVSQKLIAILNYMFITFQCIFYFFFSINGLSTFLVFELFPVISLLITILLFPIHYLIFCFFLQLILLIFLKYNWTFQIRNIELFWLPKLVFYYDNDKVSLRVVSKIQWHFFIIHIILNCYYINSINE